MRGRDLASILAYMNSHYARPLTVAGLARMAGLSRAHFIRAFRASTGTTPRQYLRARRIDRARELLVRTPMPITTICEMVGFHSLGSFSSLFRRVTGESPAAWRARRRRPPIIPGCYLRMYRVN
jgi:transcriptional regulator GlxA family with amidase domain